ncbi:MAG: hypothetical protein LBN22_09010 [Clostridiales Family XIII bacterium]|nr:hypothetical protein [Clostridiales Family XIII bacterium]
MPTINGYGSVTCLRIFEAHKVTVTTDAIDVHNGKGIVGDKHYDELRPISLLLQEAATWRDAQHEAGLCSKKFKENIRIDGIEESALIVGDILTIEGASLKIIAEKHCYDQCPLYDANRVCPMKSGGYFLMPEADGTIHVGSRVF